MVNGSLTVVADCSDFLFMGWVGKLLVSSGGQKKFSTFPATVGDSLEDYVVMLAGSGSRRKRE